MYDDLDQPWEFPVYSAWFTRRPVVTEHYAELEAVELSTNSDSCYTGPYGTNDHGGKTNGHEA